MVAEEMGLKGFYGSVARFMIKACCVYDLGMLRWAKLKIKGCLMDGVEEINKSLCCDKVNAR